MTRIVITGGPRTGKTTLAEMLREHPDVEVFHTDETIGLGWSAASEEVATWFDFTDPWIIEGVAAVRALRKWLATHPGRPCDVVYWLEEPVCERTPGQIAMANGCVTVWFGIVDELRARGVKIETTGPATMR